MKTAITAFRTEFGSRPENLVAFIGPGAGKCCYEVGKEVASLFPDEHVVREPGYKTRLDLKGLVKNSLLEDGILEQHIEISPLCTICNTDLLHSYRREGTRSGRMMAVIGIVQS